VYFHFPMATPREFSVRDSTVLGWLKQMLDAAAREGTLGPDELLARHDAIRRACEERGVCTRDMLHEEFLRAMTGKQTEAHEPPKKRRRV